MYISLQLYLLLLLKCGFPLQFTLPSSVIVIVECRCDAGQRLCVGEISLTFCFYIPELPTPLLSPTLCKCFAFSLFQSCADEVWITIIWIFKRTMNLEKISSRFSHWQCKVWKIFTLLLLSTYNVLTYTLKKPVIEKNSLWFIFCDLNKLFIHNIGNVKLV